MFLQALILNNTPSIAVISKCKKVYNIVQHNNWASAFANLTQSEQQFVVVDQNYTPIKTEFLSKAELLECSAYTPQ